MKSPIGALLTLRSLFFCIFIFILDNTIDLGTSPIVLSLAAVAGMCAATYLSSSKLNSKGFLLIGLALYVLAMSLFYGASYLPISKKGYFFITTVAANHTMLCLHFFSVAALLTWFFWKFSFTLTLEIVGLIALALELFRGHRNFHFESPRLLNNLAWEFGFQPLSMLLVTGAIVIVLLFLYIYLASLNNRLHFAKDAQSSIFANGRQGFIINLTALGLLSTVLVFICFEIFNYYEKEALTRTSNGVGLDAEKGMSPLDFHSALGSTNQPGALVRLEGDYNENPYLPMLYMRETALSEYNGKEMVVSTGGFDDDLNSTSPQQAFKIDNKEELLDRKNIVQSIYLLTDHKLAFAIDYPISINPLKNPNTKRFKGTYRATSLAPTFKLDDIQKAEVGNPKWPQTTWQHYLKQNVDHRYADLAMKITNTYSLGEKPTAEKAFLLTQYLNKNATYTLTPNHDVKTGDDPVAPFLFGDMRGYCVHFAHATVYMLRSLGIPARIATGYLTDLSQARDGHVLLRMSDRHAWAEVYLKDKGWVPFDTQPEKVESHADTQIDMKLLEELMGMLEPGEEILPEETLKDEANVHEESPFWTPQKEHVYIFMATVAILFVLLKIFVRFGWLFTFSKSSRLKRSYIAIASKIKDLGLYRLPGETRIEFRQRINEYFNIDSLALADLLNEHNYSESGSYNKELINSVRKRDLLTLKQLPLKQRLLALLNPASVFNLVTGNKW